LAGAGLGALTERGLLLHRVAAERHGGQVVDADDASPTADLRGRMVRVAGPLQVARPPRDAQFGLQAAVPVLVRRVEMFQWREVNIGGDVHYELDWVDHPIDATDFRHPPGHVNPGPFPIQGARFEAGEVRVGGFRLDPALVRALPGSETVSPAAAQLPPNLAASFSRAGDYLVTSANPRDPKLGDLRVSWEAVPAQVVTVFARPDGDTLAPAADAPDGKGYDVQVGERALVDVLPDVPTPPEFVTSRRILAVLLAAAGSLLLLLGQRRRADGLLALAMGAGLVGAIAAVLWLGHDLQLMLAWLGLAVLGAAVAAWRVRRAG
ncbi:TMEM43 family protein, partial [Fulvimonas soli]